MPFVGRYPPEPPKPVGHECTFPWYSTFLRDYSVWQCPKCNQLWQLCSDGFSIYHWAKWDFPDKWAKPRGVKPNPLV